MKNKTNKSDLILASNRGDVEEVKRLLAEGADVNTRTGCDGGYTPLIIASMKEHVEIVKVLMNEQSTKVNIQDKAYGYTALIWASDRGYADIVKEILINSVSDVDIDIQDGEGYTALIRASLAGHTDVVKELLIAGANIYTHDNRGYDALKWAEESGYSDIVEILNKHVDVNVRANDGTTALIEASSRGDAKIVKNILTKGKSSIESGEILSDFSQKRSSSRNPLKIVSYISSAAALVAVTMVASFEFNKRKFQEIEIAIATNKEMAIATNKEMAIATNKCMVYLVAKTGEKVNRKPAEIDDSKRKCLEFIND